jgi:putative thiamine transport system ATP-binding protein
MGPSGAGKSSLLAWTTGALDRAFRAEGRLWCGPAELTGLPPHKRRLGILFQDDLLFPHLSVVLPHPGMLPTRWALPHQGASVAS